MSVMQSREGRALVRRIASPTRRRWCARWAARGLVCAGAALLGGSACGARTELGVPPPLPPEPECDVDEDCPGHDSLCNPITCVSTRRYGHLLPEPPAGQLLPARVCYGLTPVDCDDDDPCTTDECVALTGDCSWSPATHDIDGDSHYAPRPGYEPGAPDSCGDDCNDASDAAFPGNLEICDGVDNDCNGIIDDNAIFNPLLDAPIQISSSGIAPAEPGGLAYSGDSYVATYSGTSAGFIGYETRLDALGNKLDPIEEPIGLQNADSYGGPLVWTGDRYGLVWEDRRDGDYEVYFTLLDWMGQKAIPDTRLTNAYGFSVNVDIAWNGTEFIVAWQDERNGLFEVMAQRVSYDGVPIGDNTPIGAEGGFDDESPSLAAGPAALGVTFTNGQPGFHLVRFGILDPQTLEPIVPVFELTDGSTEAVYPSVEWNRDHFVVVWFDKDAPLKAIYGTTIAPDGTILVPPTPLSDPGPYHSRYPQLLPLGDRSLVLYADDRDQNQGYELYVRMVAADLSPIGPEQRLTDAGYDSVSPVGAFGPDGDVGVLFRDDRLNGEHHVWFTRLGCQTNPD